MIGGVDIQLSATAGRSSLEVAVRAIRKFWKGAVFEDVERGEKFPKFSEIPFDHVHELFVYQDAAKADQWNELGAVPELENTMIHIIRDQGLLTVVIDRRTSQMEAIVETIRSGLHGTPVPCSATILEAA